MLVKLNENVAVDPSAVKMITQGTHQLYVRVELHDGTSFQVENKFQNVLEAINEGKTKSIREIVESDDRWQSMPMETFTSFHLRRWEVILDALDRKHKQYITSETQMMRSVVGALKSAKDAHPEIDYAGFESSIAKRIVKGSIKQ